MIVYTLSPPAPARLEGTLNHLEGLLNEVPIGALHIPEVHGGAKLMPRSFAKMLRKSFKARLPELIIDRVIVRTHWENHRRWLIKTWEDYGIRALVLVGGESSRVRYPGPSVAEAARLIRSLDGVDFSLGGITIPSRPAEGLRLMEKTQSGIEFFLSQVIFDAERTKELLRDYHKRCLEFGLAPKRIFLSFSPISSERDVDSLRSWRVEIPEGVERFILKGSRGAVERSLRAAERILREVLHAVEGGGINVPLGINIEPVFRRNLSAAQELASRLGEVYHAWMMTREGGCLPWKNMK
jgi:hypothetical protein